MMAAMKIFIVCLVSLAFILGAYAENKKKAVSWQMQTTPMTFYQADKTCLYMGGMLASIESLETDNLIQDYIANTPDLSDEERTQNFWVGRNDIAIEDTFVNADGTYSNGYGWCEGNPDNWLDNEDCTYYVGGGGCMGDVPCDYKYMFLCSFGE